jgi:hypothetical protein
VAAKDGAAPLHVALWPGPKARAALPDSVSRRTDGDTAMMDVVMLAIGLGFFALSIGYVIACDRL